MEVLHFLDFPKCAVVDCRILSIFGLMLRLQGGALAPMEIMVSLLMVPELSLESGVEYLIIPL